MNSTAPTALVVYESMFGNTERLASAISEGLGTAGYGVRCGEVSTTQLGNPDDLDLLVIGAPTHAFALSRASTRADAVRQGAPPNRAGCGLREWLETAHPAPSGSPSVAVFDTRIAKVRRLPAAAHTAARLARRQGFRVLDKPAPFLVEDTAGPLRAGELERARSWGETLGEACRDERAAGPTN